jgi:hypothetical protein
VGVLSANHELYGNVTSRVCDLASNALIAEKTSFGAYAIGSCSGRAR